MEEAMRPTTAVLDDNVFDFDALLHPATVFIHPKDVVQHPRLTLAEKRAIRWMVTRSCDCADRPQRLPTAWRYFLKRQPGWTFI
jgi:hypothetical protein